ncbi:hypothetical protein AZI87_04605 [Bdellovibrio bacteriovorus]|uniref:Uncharacterized protein n=1 Tax=Bdellovibrio bacteriovorus TaxID=959 RepID=A0A162GMV7_BDEBC|nr:hypothetical protein [Bdellovibrio bacteriovorus]KYG68529.1 hypothetical protein AZI87_04605 [Bdellovibrio bacteriovorus]
MKSLVAFLTFWSSIALAAPHPATSSSAFTAPEKGLYFLHKGFTLKTEGTNWVPVASSEESLLDTVRFAPRDNQTEGSLSIRTDKVAKNASLELYTRKWMRDYPNYGFEVISAKNFTLNGSPALVVDMLSRSKNKQIRQVVLKNEDRVAIMTCLDDKTRFTKALQSCNQIMKTFAWTTSEAPASKEPAPVKK